MPQKNARDKIEQLDAEVKALRARLERLADSERRYRTIAENYPDGALIILDRNFVYRFVNGCGLEKAGLTPSDLLGKPVSGILDAENFAVVQEHVQKVFEGEQAHYEIHFMGHIYENRAVPVTDAEGHIDEALIFTLDVTEQKQMEHKRIRMEAQFQEAQKLESLGVLAGGIAHDFNNILMTILGHADLALADLPHLSPARENLVAIEHASRRAADLCRQMLAYSGKGKVNIEPINLSALIEEMTHILEVSVSKKAVVKYHLDDAIPTMNADVSQMRQVIMNLVTNASEAIGECSGMIGITAGVMECDSEYLREGYPQDNLQPGRYCYIEVSDDGAGMDAETRRRIFEPFFSTKFMGRGLGMAAVLGIVKGHQGGIKVYSEPGHGTTVKILFPANAFRAAEPPAIDSPRPTAWRGSGTILLVDDEPMVRNVCRRMLEHIGFDVLVASDGRQALEMFRGGASRIACVLLDYTMPHMNGEEAFRELRRIDCNVPVILSSGYNANEVTAQFSGKGLAGFIQKPYQTKVLADQLQRVLGTGASSAPIETKPEPAN